MKKSREKIETKNNNNSTNLMGNDFKVWNTLLRDREEQGDTQVGKERERERENDTRTNEGDRNG